MRRLRLRRRDVRIVLLHRSNIVSERGGDFVNAHAFFGSAFSAYICRVLRRGESQESSAMTRRRTLPSVARHLRTSGDVLCIFVMQFGCGRRSTRVATLTGFEPDLSTSRACAISTQLCVTPYLRGGNRHFIDLLDLRRNTQFPCPNLSEHFSASPRARAEKGRVLLPMQVP